MPPYTRGRDRNLYYISLVAGGAAPGGFSLYYGFTTQDIDIVPTVSGAKTLLGHLTVVPTNGYKIVGASAPKPPRVKKNLATDPTEQSSVTTFCAPANLIAAKGQGWKTAKQGKQVKLSGGRKTVMVFATMENGSAYVFPLNRVDFATHGATLGLELASTLNTATERARAFSGATSPRPGVATLETLAAAAAGNNDAVAYSTFSTFYSTAQADSIVTAPGNWTISGETLLI